MDNAYERFEKRATKKCQSKYAIIDRLEWQAMTLVDSWPVNLLIGNRWNAPNDDYIDAIKEFYDFVISNRRN